MPPKKPTAVDLWDMYPESKKAIIGWFYCPRLINENEYEFNQTLCYPDIECVCFEYIDRGVDSWRAFRNMLQKLFPSLKTLILEQNWSCDTCDEFIRFMEDPWLKYIWIDDERSNPDELFYDENGDEEDPKHYPCIQQYEWSAETKEIIRLRVFKCRNSTILRKKLQLIEDSYEFEEWFDWFNFCSTPVNMIFESLPFKFDSFNSLKDKDVPVLIIRRNEIWKEK